MIGLKLVYYLYISKDCINSIQYKYHFACLEYYAKVFDEYDIVLATDDLSDEDTINKVEKKFLDIGFTKNVSFHVIKNDYDLREVSAFKSEIIDKLDIEDKLVMFGHGKGITHPWNEHLKEWVLAMYYFNLFDIDLLKKCMVVDMSIFHGFFVCCNNIPNRYEWYFPGTFYWINPMQLVQEIREVPNINVGNRSYAELFPGNIVDINSNSSWVPRVTFPGKYVLLGNPDLYKGFTESKKIIYSEEQLNGFNNFVKYIDNKINET